MSAVNGQSQHKSNFTNSNKLQLLRMQDKDELPILSLEEAIHLQSLQVLLL